VLLSYCLISTVQSLAIEHTEIAILIPLQHCYLWQPWVALVSGQTPPPNSLCLIPLIAQRQAVVR